MCCPWHRSPQDALDAGSSIPAPRAWSIPWALPLNGLFPWQDLEKESDTPLQQVSIEEILEEQRLEQQAKQESEKLKVQALKERGLCVPRADTLDEY